MEHNSPESHNQKSKHWQHHINQCHQSEMSQRHYCQLNNLPSQLSASGKERSVKYKKAKSNFTHWSYPVISVRPIILVWNCMWWRNDSALRLQRTFHLLPWKGSSQPLKLWCQLDQAPGCNLLSSIPWLSLQKVAVWIYTGISATCMKIFRLHSPMMIIGSCCHISLLLSSWLCPKISVWFNERLT